MQGAAAAQAQAPSSAERNVLLRGGRQRGPKPSKPRRPPRASFIAALKPARSASPAARRVRGLTHPRPLPPPPASSRPPPSDPLQRSPKVGQSLHRAYARPCPRMPLAQSPRAAECPPRLSSPLPAPPARSLPPPPPSITQKLVKLVPDSWRRAPLQERKKGKRKREKAGAREREGERKAHGTKPCATCAPSTVVPVPHPAPPNLMGKPRTLGDRGRAQHRSIIYGRINYSAARGRGGGGKAWGGEGSCGDHPARGRSSPAGPRGSGGVSALGVLL